MVLAGYRALEMIKAARTEEAVGPYVGVFEAVNRYKHASRRYEDKEDNTSNIPDPSDTCGREAYNIWLTVGRPISFYTPVKAGDTRRLVDCLADNHAIQPFDAAAKGNLSEHTRRVLATLSPREEKILRMRFGIGERCDHTLEEISQSFSLTRERIRQIEAQALKKLRHPKVCRRLKTFLE